MDGSSLMFSWWHDADFVVRGVFVVLVVLSLVTWTLIVFKGLQYRRVHRAEQQVSHYLGNDQRSRVAEVPHTVSHRVAAGDRAPGGQADETLLGQRLTLQRIALESYLTMLATVGNSAPFIGLLGTVWGIMHALQGLDSSAGLSLEIVAGPVAEALVATAMGLFAAIPAVIGYNLLLRRLRCLMAHVEANVTHLRMTPSVSALKE